VCESATLLRQGVDAAGRFNHQNVLSKLPVLMQTVHDDTHRTFKASVLTDADTPEEDLAQAGTLGQVIAQEVTGAVGGQTDQAVGQHLARLQAEFPATIDAPAAKQAQTFTIGGPNLCWLCPRPQAALQQFAAEPLTEGGCAGFPYTGYSWF